MAGGGGAAPSVEGRRGRRSGLSQPPPVEVGERFVLPASGATLAELFAHPGDGGWAGLLRAWLATERPLLWVQERMAMLEGGRVYPPGLGLDLIHVCARDAREALWAMEEGLRCPGLSAVVGEIYGDPARLDFTATRRLAVAAERSGVAAWLVRLNGTANLSGARRRWRVASAPSLANPFDPKAPGASAWDAELFRARGSPPGRWTLGHDPAGTGADPVRLVAAAGDRAVEQGERRAG
ncbi:hypothetical protein ABDK56_09240 [Sphingomonas sp. ASV193]|uniref:ImuA family protein n=1 Tax=Sphingomonas sp. ASV193 TaxID=3144405 RepID=UPI0032E878AE